VAGAIKFARIAEAVATTPMSDVGVEVDHGWLWLMTDIQYLQPEYFSFMPTAPRVATSAPDEYLGGDDNG
jgi:hypothetical protein